MAQKRKKRRKRARKSGTAPILLVLLALALIFFFGLRMLLRAGTTKEEPVRVTAVAQETMPPSYVVKECFGTENGYKTYRADDLTAKLGIDVSAYQGDIDWETVADSGIEFAILRAGYRGYAEGETGIDEYFQYNLEQTKKYGVDIGIYFFSQAMTEAEARNEALEVLKLVDGYEIKYPIYFDWEPISDSDARTATISSTELTRCAQVFCQTIESAGYQAGVYFNLDLAAHYYHLKDLTEYSFWLAEYEDTPSFPYRFDMWQYTSSGEVPGISTVVDLNLSFLAIE